MYKFILYYQYMFVIKNCLVKLFFNLIEMNKSQKLAFAIKQPSENGQTKIPESLRIIYAGKAMYLSAGHFV